VDDKKANLMSQHILFVDDEVPIRETLSLYFKRKGFSVTSAGNSQNAKLAVSQNSFNLIILDVDLGGEYGLELLEFFKQNHPAIPVIMFTSLGYDPELLKEAMARGATAFMSKAESLDNLYKEVQRVCLPEKSSA
jgi:DNA-binding NtrC family response regulator